jgi:hypothetical protein
VHLEYADLAGADLTGVARSTMGRPAGPLASTLERTVPSWFAHPHSARHLTRTDPRTITLTPFPNKISLNRI